MSDFTTERPTEDGWYDVIWEPGDLPSRVYLWVNPDGSIVWRWHKTDDPECIEQDISEPEKIQFRKAGGPERITVRAGSRHIDLLVRMPRGILTQHAIDARPDGWERRSDSRNAAMARLLNGVKSDD